MTRQGLIDVEDLEYVTQTDLAWCIRNPNDDDEVIWLPKSQVERDGTTYTMYESLAIAKGLV